MDKGGFGWGTASCACFSSLENAGVVAALCQGPWPLCRWLKPGKDAAGADNVEHSGERAASDEQRAKKRKVLMARGCNRHLLISGFEALLSLRCLAVQPKLTENLAEAEAEMMVVWTEFPPALSNHHL